MLEPTPATRIAIEFLTLWMESGQQARQQAAEHMFTVLHGTDGPTPESVIAGQLNLSTLLVLMLAKERGSSGDDLAQAASTILQDLSRQLPE